MVAPITPEQREEMILTFGGGLASTLGTLKPRPPKIITKEKNTLMEQSTIIKASIKANNVRTAYELAELLAEMTTTYETKHVNNFAVLMQEARSEGDMPTVEAWTYICMVVNWLSWAWAENDEPELSEAWGKEWNKINKFSLDNLKGSDLKYYLEKTD